MAKVNVKPVAKPTAPLTGEEAMKAELARLQAENRRLKEDKNKPRELTFKVSVKGAVSVYGMGRFPVTIYKEQWIKLLGKKEEILAFIEANADVLSSKADKALAADAAAIEALGG